MVSPLLMTKLSLPQARHNLVLRPRLMERLNASLEHPLSLVSAPAGFGKSTLLSQWIHLHFETAQLATHTAWISLDTDDDDPARFLEYILAAFELLLHEAIHLGTARVLLQGQQNPPVKLIFTDLLNQLADLSEDTLLILDDFHAVQSREILEGIAFLVEHLPARLHVILLSRSDPSLPLGRWRVRGQLNEIRSADLRFNIEEANLYLNQAQTLGLSAQEIDALEQRTEGWIAGLQMAAITLRDRAPDSIAQFMNDFSGQHHLILDYLTDEVLQQQPESIQRFLLMTSLFNRISPDLCNALLGDGDENAVNYGQILEQLDHANLFLIPLDNNRIWYRYHHLFGELLQVRLKEQYPQRIPELHKKASGWFEKNGYPFEAMQHALAAGDLILATDVIERTVRNPATWATGNISRMLDTVNSLPYDIISGRPWLRAYLSGIIYVGGQLEVADQLLAQIEGNLSDNKGIPSAEREELELFSNAFRGFYAATRGDADNAVRRANIVLSKVTSDDRRVYGHALATLGQAALVAGDLEKARELYQQAIENQKQKNARFTAVTWSSNLADVLTAQGRLLEAFKVCEDTIQYGSKDGKPGPAVGYTQTYQAAVLFEWNRLEDAEKTLLDGLRLMQKDGISPNFGRAHATLAMIQQELGKPADASNSMEIAVQLAGRSQAQRYIHLIAAFQARLWLAQGELSRAQQWTRQKMESSSEQGLATPLQAAFEDLTLARVLWSEDRFEEAQRIADRSIQDAETRNWPGILIEALALRALLTSQQAGRALQARELLLRALTLSLPGQYKRTYLDFGLPMERLLQSVEAADPSLKTYRNRLLGGFRATEPGHKPDVDQAGLIEKLSDRELEILQLIAAGLTNSQIAKKLYLTVNTIRAHSRHIFGKLDSHSRTEAVARARELGLLK